MRLEKVDNKFEKNFDLETLGKEMLLKYFKKDGKYKLTFENNYFVLDSNPDAIFFKKIEKIYAEEIITKIQEELLKDNISHFYETIDPKNSSKKYTIDILSKNLEPTIRVYGTNKLHVYLKIYIIVIQDEDKKLRHFKDGV